MKLNYLEPIDSEMETISPEPVQETKDPEWQMVETNKTKKEEKRRKEWSEEEGAN